jgi:hypothetical protein
MVGMRPQVIALGLMLGSIAPIGCSSAGDSTDSKNAGAGAPKNPDNAPVVMVDRFSDAAAHLFKRSSNPAMPAANAPIDCDQGPFITHGLGPGGEKVTYYNFDVQPSAPAPVYVFVTKGASAPVAGQLDVIDVLPGDPGYSDFRLVNEVTVPTSYVANSVTSLAEIRAAGYPVTPTNRIMNYPVVPDGSTANLRYSRSESTSLQRGWYRDQVVKYLSFEERPLTADANGMVPVVPILVAFNRNPDKNDPKSGPASGFMAEPGTSETHNVVAALPEDASYSPLWSVIAYSNADFASVNNLRTASAAKVVVQNLGNVNCPVVAKQ